MSWRAFHQAKLCSNFSGIGDADPPQDGQGQEGPEDKSQDDGGGLTGKIVVLLYCAVCKFFEILESMEDRWYELEQEVEAGQWWTDEEALKRIYEGVWTWP